MFVIDDTFNSNPQGAARALDTLVQAVPDGRRAVVTPGMVELGRSQDEENRVFAARVAASGTTLVVVGYTNRRALLAGANGAPTVVVRDRDAARDMGARQPRRGRRRPLGERPPRPLPVTIAPFVSTPARLPYLQQELLL